MHTLRRIHGIEETDPRLLEGEDLELFKELEDWESGQCETEPIYSEKLSEIL